MQSATKLRPKCYTYMIWICVWVFDSQNMRREEYTGCWRAWPTSEVTCSSFLSTGQYHYAVTTNSNADELTDRDLRKIWETDSCLCTPRPVHMLLETVPVEWTTSRTLIVWTLDRFPLWHKNTLRLTAIASKSLLPEQWTETARKTRNIRKCGKAIIIFFGSEEL